MRPENAGILITGAAGGIGSATARRVGRAGARLLLTDLRPEPLEALAAELRADGITVDVLAADVGDSDDRATLARIADLGDINVLINVAGINPFGCFSEQSEAEIERAFRVNTLAPIALVHELLPVLGKRAEAHIVNVGSVFGSLGYPGFAVYSASKFAMRGFTEALRRELADTSIRLHYVAPRATRTALSTDRISAMNAQLNVATDPPETVAAAIERTLVRSRRETYCGLPERVFGILNALWPGLIDRALRKQLPIVKRYASKAPSETHSDRPAMNVKPLGVER